MIFHTLSVNDQEWATDVARRRVAEAKGNPRFGYDPGTTPLGTHANAAMAQLAVARALGIEWAAPVNTYGDAPNVGLWWNARWSSSSRRVKIAPKDGLDWLHVHVTGAAPTFEIRGYVIVRWVKEARPLEDMGGRGFAAYFADQSVLAPFDVGFHKICAWSDTMPQRSGFVCIYCGKSFEGAA